MCTVLGTTACTQGNDADARAQTVGDTIGRARRLAVVPPPVTPYRVVAVSEPGSITGQILFPGTPRGDTLIQVAEDQNGCGKPLTIARLEREHGAVANAVVWLSDIRAGRALPFERRFTLRNSNCAWDPVIQTASMDGTLHIINTDALVDDAFITNIATGDTVGVAPFTDAGQIIPYDRILKTPGVYELSVDSRPMSRAWVVVLDHPYRAVTSRDGRFTIDSVPPGTYAIRAWHPMLGVVNGQVRVAPNTPASIDLVFP